MMQHDIYGVASQPQPRLPPLLAMEDVHDKLQDLGVYTDCSLY